MSTAVREAAALAQAGQTEAAVARLEAATGDGAALYALALWRIEGRLVARDLARARAEIGRAAATGVAPARRALAALLATGTGGATDWAGALAAIADDRGQSDLIAAMDVDACGDPVSVPAPEVLSADPYVARFPAICTAAECAFLAKAAAARFKPATIFHEGRGAFVADPLRNGETAGFPVILEAPAVHALNRRLAAASGTDVRQGEPLQLLRYRPGQQYKPHLDAIPTLANQRVLTFLVYLNDDFVGGETDFPELGLRVAARAGMGLLFANALPDGQPDPRTRHAGLPVTSGEKLVASRWIRARAPDGDAGFGRHEAEGQ